MVSEFMPSHPSSITRILVIEDECEGMNSETIRQYARFLRNAIQGRMAAILLCHSNLAASILSDNYVIFRKGRVVKKWRKEFPHNNGRLSDYLLGNTMTLKKKTLDSYARKVHAGEGVIYGIRKMCIRDSPGAAHLSKRHSWAGAGQ